VCRQGLEPRTVALREPEGRFLDLRRFAGIGSDLGACLPLLSAADQGLPIVRGPSAAHAGARGGHGRRGRTRRRRGGDGHQLGRWARLVQGNTGLVGKSPQEARQSGNCGAGTGVILHGGLE
jgi:hypothetical protein